MNGLFSFQSHQNIIGVVVSLIFFLLLQIKLPCQLAKELFIGKRLHTNRFQYSREEQGLEWVSHLTMINQFLHCFLTPLALLVYFVRTWCVFLCGFNIFAYLPIKEKKQHQVTRTLPLGIRTSQVKMLTSEVAQDIHAK